MLAAASQRLEYVILEWFGNEWMHGILREWERKERGAFPGLVETAIIIYVQGDQPQKNKPTPNPRPFPFKIDSNIFPSKLVIICIHKCLVICPLPPHHHRERSILKNKRVN